MCVRSAPLAESQSDLSESRRDGGRRGRDDIEVELQIKETTGNDRVRDEGTRRGRGDIVRYEM